MKSRWKVLILFFFLVVSLSMAILSGYFGLNLSGLETLISLNKVLAGIIYALVFVTLIAFSFSISVLEVFGLFLFPAYVVVLCAVIGVLGGAIIDFFIARKLGKNCVKEYLNRRGGMIERFDEVLEKDTFKTILILSAIFFVPPLLPNFLGGIMNINFKKYVIAIFVGNLPNVAFMIYLLNGLLYSNIIQVYIGVAGIAIVSLTALYFYTGEIKGLLKIGFPWLFRKK